MTTPDAAMPVRNLGRSGLKVSALSFGSWVTFHEQLDLGRVKECMAAAFAGGCNLFDNAEAYAGGEAERLMGRAIAELGWGRDTFVVTTKLFWGGEGPNQVGLSRKHVIEGTRASLDRMGLDAVDILYCHRPDLHVPIEETVRAMNHVIDRGWAYYWGTSEWSAEQVREAWRVADRLGLIGPAVEQPQYHLFHRERVEREYAGLVRDLGLGLTTWSPLASGLLSGKYNDGLPEGSRLALPSLDWLRELVLGEPGFQDKVRRLRHLGALAADLGVSTAQLAIAWCAANPAVSSVITGASSPAQVEENMAAAGLIARLDADLLDRIDEICGTRPAPEQDFRG